MSPDNWTGTGSLKRTVIAIHVVGVALIAGVPVFVPVLTGQRSFLRGQDLDVESRAVMVGEAQEGGLFAVFRNARPTGVGSCSNRRPLGTASRARDALEDALGPLWAVVESASVLEIERAFFELHETDVQTGWEWCFVDKGGDKLPCSVPSYE